MDELAVKGFPRLYDGVFERQNKMLASFKMLLNSLK
jgi:hypothetical protein